MAQQRTARTPGEQTEAVVQAQHDLLHRERPQPPGRQLDGQRDAVQAVAEQRDLLGVVLVQDELRQHGRRPVREQPYGVRGAAGHGGHRQRGHRQQVLGRAPQRLPAGGQHPEPGGRPQQRVHQLGAGRHQVLAAVQHQQQLAIGQLLGQYVDRRPGRGVGQPQRLQDGVPEQLRGLHPGDLDQPDAVREAARRLGQGGGAQR